jgi:hypothetical protein
MTDTWAATCVPGHHYVAGVKLRPLTYGHSILMARLGLFEVLTPLDFHAFVGICSRNYANASRWLGWFLSPVGQWWYTRKPMPGPYNEVMKAALEYLEANRQAPETLSSDVGTGGAGGYGTPGLQMMRTIAIERLNYSPDTINDAPFGQLVWDILSSNELRGGSRIIEGKLADGLNRLSEMQKAANESKS